MRGARLAPSYNPRCDGSSLLVWGAFAFPSRDRVESVVDDRSEETARETAMESVRARSGFVVSPEQRKDAYTESLPLLGKLALRKPLRMQFERRHGGNRRALRESGPRRIEEALFRAEARAQ